MKVAPTCSGVKGIIRNKRRSVSETYPQTHTEKLSNAATEMKEIPSKVIQQDESLELAKQIGQTSLLSDCAPSARLAEEKKDEEEEKEEAVKLILEAESALEADTAITIPNIVASASRPSTEVKAPASPSKETDSDTLQLQPGSLAQVLYDYFATNPEEVNIHEGEHVIVVKTGMLLYPFLSKESQEHNAN